ncbi:hypothetical protein BH09PSE4_BH09PSE4_07380 [soil metagenome]
MADVELDYAVPSIDVGEFVTLFYHFRADLPLFSDTERADHAQLRFRLSGGTSEYRMPDGSVQAGPSIQIVGPTSGAIGVSAIGPVHVFGMGLTASGWAAMIGNDASTMLNRVIDARTLFGERLDATAAALAAAPDTAAMVAIVEPLIRSLAEGGSAGSLAFVRQVDSWLANHASPDVETLVAATGLSRRQVERRCNALYGAPPKLLARKYRALRAAVALYAEAASPADLIAHGFYDQSHLIREIKHFTGLTPRKIKAEPSVLAQLTMAQRHALCGQVSPLISNT